MRVLEAGETPLPAEQRRKDDAAIVACALWGPKVTPQQRLRALRIAIPRDHGVGEQLPAHTLGDRVAWIVVEGELVLDGESLGPGALVYPESLVADSPRPGSRCDRRGARDVRALAIRADDFRELCDDDSELGEALLEGLAAAIAAKRVPRPRPRPIVDARATTDPPAALEVVLGPDQSSGVPAPMARVITPPYGMVARPSPARVAMGARPAPAPEDDEPPRPTQSHHRPPTEPEIETVVEMEADDPPDPRFAGDDDNEFESMTVTSDDDAVVVDASADDTEGQSAEIEMEADEPPARPDRPITATDNATVSGEIPEIPGEPTHARARRVSDGWDD